MTRETLRCPHCNLNQFKPESDLCRRCHKSMAPPPPEPEPVVVEVEVSTPGAPNDLVRAVQCVLASRSGQMSQKMLALRMGCERTYISKCERGGCIPTLGTLENYAHGLRIPMWVLVKEIEMTRVMLTAARKGASDDVARLGTDEMANAVAVFAKVESSSMTEVKP